MLWTLSDNEHSNDGRYGKDYNFSIDEDKKISHCWIQIFEVPIIGLSQRKENFWKRFSSLFHITPPTIDLGRTTRAIQSQFGLINKAYTKFGGSLAKSHSKEKSG